MPRFLPDASVTLAWCFEDEASAWTDRLLVRLKSGDQATVPAHWPVEVANALLVAIRRGRITREKGTRFLEDLRALPIQVDPKSTESAFDRVFTLAEQHGLTIYDAAYLELATRENLPLATLDSDLQKAARAAGVILIEQS